MGQLWSNGRTMSDRLLPTSPDGAGGGLKKPLKLTVDDGTRTEAERLALARGLTYSGRGNVSALFSMLVREEVQRKDVAATTLLLKP